MRDNNESPSIDVTPPERVAWAHARLVEMWGEPEWRPSGDALGELVATILSQHTSDINSDRAYQRLREAFPSWEAVRDAPISSVEDAIRIGGLAQVKAERIQRVLREITERRGAIDVSDLATLPLDDARHALESLSGVGPKTAACVLLFALGQPAFPVDTHVLRVTQRFGLIGSSTGANDAHKALEQQIPPEWRYSMHIDLIQHGRRICHAQRPACELCGLRARCVYFQALRPTR